VAEEMPTVEELFKRPEQERYNLRLYVMGNTPCSVRALTNLKAICDGKLQNRYDLAVIDLHQQEGDRKDDEIVVAPTLVKRRPLPVEHLIGDLSDTQKVLEVLRLEGDTP
jgi:circadian clock protein KaiB